MAKIYKNPNEMFDDEEYDADYERSWGPDKSKILGKLKFEDLKDDELLDHFINSSGFGFTGKIKNGGFHFSGPDWEKSYNPMTRQQVIDELNERKRIDLEEDGDWFEYLI